MSKETYFQRYSLIIKRLERGPATFEQIEAYLQRETEIQGRNLSVSKRTFQRDIKEIYSHFNIEIANEKKGDKRYFIKSQPEKQEYSRRLLDAYEMVNVVKASQEYFSHLFFEKRKPKGLEHFSSLLHAVKNKKIIHFDYFKYWEEVISKRTVHPLALKEAKGRWYLIAVDTKDENLKAFGLDRMSNLNISTTSFRNEYVDNVDEMFSHSFGVMNNTELEPQVIRLSFDYEQGQYIKAYPLHHSQKIIREGNSVAIELFIRPTYDFIMEILSYGEMVSVLSPDSLAKEIRKIAGNVFKKYQ